MSFDTLYKEFSETKNGDLCKFCNKYKDNSVATHFLLVRTFGTKNIESILNKHGIPFEIYDEKKMMKLLYDSKIGIKDLLEYIEAKRTDLIEERIEELEGLQKLIKEIPIVDCGIRDDNINALVKSFTRNKELKTIDSVNDFLYDQVVLRFSQYCLWSFYNQTTNDIIEIFLLQHPKVIPPPRKITNIDFFLQIRDEIVPFDQKITHVSDNYFELASQWLIEQQNGSDNFQNSYSKKEFQRIKEYYKAYKKAHKELQLPNIGDLPTKNQISLIMLLLYITTLLCLLK